MSKTVTGLIRPFNLDQAERKAMFDSAVPDSMIIVLHTLLDPYDETPVESAIDEEMDDHLYRQLQFCIGEADHFGIKSKLECTDDDTDDVDWTPVWVHPTPEQSEWVVNGTYIQVSFYDPTRIDRARPRLDLATAMTLYDYGYCQHQDVDPTNHAELKVRDIHARDARLIIGDVYRERVGVWCRPLVDFRTMIMVKCRAMLLKRDPDDEFDRFIQAGGKYCLDYPVLCP